MTSAPKIEPIYLELDDRFEWSDVSLREDFRKKAVGATMRATYALHNAANVFHLIHSGMVAGFLDNQEAGVSSLAELCGFALQRIAETDGEVLEHLSGMLETNARPRAMEDKA